MFPTYTSAMTVILNVVDGADVATNEDSEDVISLYTTDRRRCDAAVSYTHLTLPTIYSV